MCRVSLVLGRLFGWDDGAWLIVLLLVWCSVRVIVAGWGVCCAGRALTTLLNALLYGPEPELHRV